MSKVTTCCGHVQGQLVSYFMYIRRASPSLTYNDNQFIQLTYSHVITVQQSIAKEKVMFHRVSYG